MRDRLLAGALIVVMAVVIWGTLELPPPSFEPLGAAAFPRGLAILIALLALPILFGRDRRGPAIPEQAGSPAGEGTGGDGIVRRQPLMAVILIAAAAGLAALMQVRTIDFSILATAFLFATMTALNRFSIRAMPLSILIALVVGFGIDYIFTQVLIVDLP
jgi:putative tricarboxylic transport membrane protein